jgi:hypothetical protein
MSKPDENAETGISPKPKYYSGIVKLPPRPPKSAEEIQADIDEVNERQFNPHVKHGGRNGNIVMPLD